MDSKKFAENNITKHYMAADYYTSVNPKLAACYM